MIVYLIRSTLCLGLMLVVYLLFLEKEKMYRFNRFYLLGSLVFSFLVPFIVIEDFSNSVLELPSVVIPDFEKELALPTQIIVFVAYAFISSALVLRLIRNAYVILSRASVNQRIPFHSAQLVLVKNITISHTFWNYIFVDADEYASRSIAKEIFTHELAHAKQKHTLDVLFIKLLQAVFWFNPVLVLYRRAIQMNHEFLADEAVVQAYNNARNYQLLLLDKISGQGQITLSSGLNYRVTKKRLMMLALKTANRKSVLLKKFLVVPVVLTSVLFFSTKADIIPLKTNKDAISASVNTGSEKHGESPKVDIDIPVSIEIVPPN